MDEIFASMLSKEYEFMLDDPKYKGLWFHPLPGGEFDKLVDGRPFVLALASTDENDYVLAFYPNMDVDDDTAISCGTTIVNKIDVEAGLVQFTLQRLTSKVGKCLAVRNLLDNEDRILDFDGAHGGVRSLEKHMLN